MYSKIESGRFRSTGIGYDYIDVRIIVKNFDGVFLGYGLVPPE